MALGVALRYVMEALQKPLNSKMYYFGVLALDRFRTRLKEYPRYCHHIMEIEHFTGFPAHIAEVSTNNCCTSLISGQVMDHLVAIRLYRCSRFKQSAVSGDK